MSQPEQNQEAKVWMEKIRTAVENNHCRFCGNLSPDAHPTMAERCKLDVDSCVEDIETVLTEAYARGEREGREKMMEEMKEKISQEIEDCDKMVNGSEHIYNLSFILARISRLSSLKSSSKNV